jgi:uncharacterized protein (DUF1501 family)
VHQLQGKTEGVKHPELRQFLTEFAADRVALLQRHEAGARAVGHYDFNNTYQYVINREETHLGWLQTALADYAAPLPSASAALPVPVVTDGPERRSFLRRAKKVDPADYSGILEDDARRLNEFVARWRARLGDVAHARHRLMLNVVLGESQEHERLFEQAAAGFEDVLGRRTGGVPRQGSVLPTRWLE